MNEGWARVDPHLRSSPEHKAGNTKDDQASTDPLGCIHVPCSWSTGESNNKERKLKWKAVGDVDGK